MAGRALAFSDPEVLRLVRERFVPLAGDEWYYRRRRDQEGAFFHHVADQGRRGRGGGTRQGIYVFGATGVLLAYEPGDVLPARLLSVLQGSLDAFARLPEADRRPGAAAIPELTGADPQLTRAPPEGGLIARVYARLLDREGAGALCPSKARVMVGESSLPPFPQRDHLWLTAAEWRSLVPARPRPGAAAPVPQGIAWRILRFHLLDSTRGEPEPWRLEDVRSSAMTLTVEEATPAAVRLRLDGAALLATSADPASAARGFAVRLLGTLRYDARLRALDRFDVLAVGDHWGDGPYTAGSRPGRTPLGIAFELATGDAEADRIPPQMARHPESYFSAASVEYEHGR